MSWMSKASGSGAASCASTRTAIEAAIRKHAPQAVRIGLETGPLTTWLWQALTDAGLPMVCLDARKAKAALNMGTNKTDANDAEGLAHLVRSGWYREVRVKGREAMLVRSLLGARTQLLGIVTELSNQIRGVMKTFGLVVPKGGRRGSSRPTCAGCSRARRRWPASSLPLLEAWRAVRARLPCSTVSSLAAARAERGLPPADDGARHRRHRRRCRSLRRSRTPENFGNSRAVGAWIGLTPRRYQSGEVDYDGHISRRGDARLRALLYEAAMAMLTRVQRESDAAPLGPGPEEAGRLQARRRRAGAQAGGGHARDVEDRHRLRPRAAGGSRLNPFRVTLRREAAAMS